MKNKLRFLVLMASLLPFVQTFAQADHFVCGTDALRKELIEQNPEILIIEQELEEFTRQFAASGASGARSGPYIIPVVFHIIHRGGTENISDAQVYDQMRILNEDYNKRNADTVDIVHSFQPLIANVGIEFRLATIDPDGNPTTGIEHIYHSATYQGNDYARLNPWPRDKYLNVWVFNKMGGGAAGYSRYPSAVTAIAEYPLMDGINILDSYVGSIGTSNSGRDGALTHEVGHYLNLKHVWGDNNDPGQGCGDDDVEDTPVTKGHTSCGVLLGDFDCDNQSFSAVYNFESVTTTSGVVDTTTPPNKISSSTNSLALQFSAPTANGVSSNSTVDGSFAFSNWATGAADGDSVYSALTGSINLNKYYEFTVSPVPGQSMTISSITFDVKRDTSGVRTFAVRSSATSNFGMNLPSTVFPVSPLLNVQSGNIFFFRSDTSASVSGVRISLAGNNAYTNKFDPITFRIYGFNAEDSTGTFEVDSIVINGAFGTTENSQNFMDYSYCAAEMFTEKQKLRMLAALNSNVSHRSNLWDPDNLVATGTDHTNGCTTCVPIVDFSPNKFVICTGDPVIYKDHSYNYVGTANLSWDLPGSDVLTSTASSVTARYSAPGVYPVTLTVQNANGSSSKTQSLVYVKDNTNIATAPYYTGFENQAEFEYWWSPVNVDRDEAQFQYCSTAGRNQSKSIMLNAYKNYADINVDELISPPFDCSALTNNAFLSFYYSFATWNSSSNPTIDSIVVYAQKGCNNNSWIKLDKEGIANTFKGGDLFNAGFQDGFYVPGPDQIYWRKVTLEIPASPTNLRARDVRFRLVVYSSHGANNFYLDDWNIGLSPTGIDEVTFDNVNIMPNPFTSKVRIENLPNEKFDYEVHDITGRLLQAQPLIQNGDAAEIDLSSISSKGIYLLTLKHKNSVKTFRLVKN